MNLQAVSSEPSPAGLEALQAPSADSYGFSRIPKDYERDSYVFLCIPQGSLGFLRIPIDSLRVLEILSDF